ncbi:hypothetical protein T8A63_07125 [Sulfitobacter sp. OXR-159]|uniref:hypothetical protein n=1 Tax=Sulfitobacter sp. OXR-159 TaxID=3100174 RepID=UPI002AC8AEFD|nr:hypothetical protein [Sulfitobacter sp. OXR-159]WPZ30727.1 hypothetical protein T8A63_06615 [Sulfitobacter sp. OXR-159]WPZ30828.1 hypothetical protein T8A63_07125 [Sulfitobacter sp. OXR-159]
MNVQARNPEIDSLVAEINRYRKEHGVSKTAFGAWAVKDPNLLRDLEGGRELRWSTIQAIRDKMAGVAQ